MRVLSTLLLLTSGAVGLGACRQNPGDVATSPDAGNTADAALDAGSPDVCDRDGDGHRAEGQCRGDDCDDSRSRAWPGAPDLAGDALDTDCDGADGVDADGDGWAGEVSGGTDCDDEDPAVHPGAMDGQLPGEVVGSVGGEPSLAIGPDGALHVASVLYGGGGAGLDQPWYTTNATGEWLEEPIDAGYGRVPSIAVDAGGTVHVAYVGEVGVAYGLRTDEGWVLQTVEEAGWVGDLAVRADADGVAHVVYAPEYDRVVYASRRDGKWDRSEVARGDWFYDPSLALDGAGAAHVVYYAGISLEYATNASGRWATEEVDADEAESGGTSIALSGDEVRLSYRGFLHDLRVATRRSGVWSIEVLREWWDTGWSSSIGVDGSGADHVAYQDATNGEVRYATDASGAWVQSTIDEGGSPSLAIGAEDVVHVVYSQDRDLLHAPPPGPDGVDDDCDGVAF